MASQFTSQPWMQGNSESESLNLSGMPPEDAIKLQKLSRKQQLANYLLQKALTGQQGGMAGKFYVAPSWTQGVAQLAEAGLGTYMNKNIDDERSLMAQEIEKRRQGEIDAYQQATSPKAVQPEMPVDSTLVPDTFDIEKLQPDQQRFQARDANATAYVNTAAPGEVETGALTDNISKIGSVVPDPQMAAPERAIPVGDPIMQAPDPIKARQATLWAMMSKDPRVAQSVRFMEQQKAAEEEKAMQRTFMGEQKAEDRANRLENTRLGFSRDLMMAKMMGMNKEDLAALEAKQRQELEKIRQEGANRRDNLETTVAADSSSPTGWSEYDKRTGKVVTRGVAPPMSAVKQETDKAKTGAGKKLSATVEKELFDTDEMILAGKEVQRGLQSALALNDKALGGMGAGALAAAGTLLPDKMRPETIDATNELDNIVANTALPQLKILFGGMPTEGERKVLLDLQGMSGKNASVRKGILERAQAAAQRREAFNRKKADAIRKGTYFQEQFTDDAPLEPTAPANAAPSGSNDEEFKKLLEQYK